MMRRIVFTSLCLISVLVSCKREADQDEYLKAFSDTYGVVRWFYPGDEAQDVDWNALALYGVQRIKTVRSADELQSALQDMFSPIACAVVISNDSEYDIHKIIPDDKSGIREIAWQHNGVDLGKWSNSYVSKRTYRPFESEGLNRAVIEMEMPAAGYIGEDLTFSIAIENKTPSSFEVYAKMSLDYNDPEAYVNLCEFTSEYQVQGKLKNRLSIGKNDSNKLIRICIYTKGSGEFEIKDCRLAGSGFDVNILKQPFRRNVTVYDYRLSDQGCAVSTKELLFDEHSHIGDVKTLELPGGLYAHIPLALYGNEEQTYPLPEDGSIKPDYTTSVATATDREMTLADLIVTWNAMNYFHPYLSDEVEDWDSCLMRAFDEVNECEKYSLDPLRRMMANVNDAHFTASSPREAKDYGFLPLLATRRNDKIIVTKSADPSIHIGDEVVKIGGVDAVERFKECEELVSGSPQYQTYIARQIFPRLHADETEVTLLRDGDRFSTKVRRMERNEFISSLMTDSNIESSRWISTDTLYLNTGSSSLSEICTLLKERKDNQTVLIDISNGNSFLLASILPYIADSRDLLPMREGINRTPQVYAPVSPVIEDDLEDVEIPELEYDNIFITGPMNYSHDEEVVDYALYCGIARTTGEATAGCNGRINRMTLPSGGTMYFTGMKVLSNLGKQGYYYGKGIPAND